MPEKSNDKRQQPETPKEPKRGKDKPTKRSPDDECPWCGERGCTTHADLERTYRRLFE